MGLYEKLLTAIYEYEEFIKDNPRAEILRDYWEPEYANKNKQISKLVGKISENYNPTNEFLLISGQRDNNFFHAPEMVLEYLGANTKNASIYKKNVIGNFCGANAENLIIKTEGCTDKNLFYNAKNSLFIGHSFGLEAFQKSENCRAIVYDMIFPIEHSNAKNLIIFSFIDLLERYGTKENIETIFEQPFKIYDAIPKNELNAIFNSYTNLPTRLKKSVLISYNDKGKIMNETIMNAKTLYDDVKVIRSLAYMKNAVLSDHLIFGENKRKEIIKCYFDQAIKEYKTDIKENYIRRLENYFKKWMI